MAAENFANINPVLSSLFSRLMVDSRNREARAVRLIKAKKGDSGKSVQWGNKSSGSETARAVVEGADIDAGELNPSNKQAANLPYVSYRAIASVTDQAVMLAQGAASSPEILMDMLGNEVMDGILRLVKLINADLYSGTGSNGFGGAPNIVGLNALAALNTGVYAGIDRSTNTEWRGNVIGNGGNPWPITDDLMRQAEAAAWAGGGKINSILTTGSVHRKYAGLFNGIQRVQTQGPAPASYGMGTMDLSWGSMEIIRDVDAPAGELLMFDSDEVDLVYPANFEPIMADGVNLMTAKEREAYDARGNAGFPVLVQEFPRAGNTMRLAIWTMIQLRVRRPRSTSLIQDISES